MREILQRKGGCCLIVYKCDYTPTSLPFENEEEVIQRLQISVHLLLVLLVFLHGCTSDELKHVHAPDFVQHDLPQVIRPPVA